MKFFYTDKGLPQIKAREERAPRRKDAELVFEARLGNQDKALE